MSKTIGSNRRSGRSTSATADAATVCKTKQGADPEWIGPLFSQHPTPITRHPSLPAVAEEGRNIHVVGRVIERRLRPLRRLLKRRRLADWLVLWLCLGRR